ncbi:hypothetical protein P168DRAFT_12051 [Aspergillus campestris IBT 28561]|uniref:Uncharacterized protein n=1 Tax=Aspergillus campestris (strain IBT 28561) TaxID=1392248 RepID=A0A2I1DEC5_ASPC2|nr:uncharacterized protein P168DRAFT_12051 [Aspergillus campestris IBT 28561]PKY08235.1 hypothetical protein P168DRAFT_12051 [Aspergillus campestris IBT 28561]
MGDPFDDMEMDACFSFSFFLFPLFSFLSLFPCLFCSCFLFLYLTVSPGGLRRAGGVGRDVSCRVDLNRHIRPHDLFLLCCISTCRYQGRRSVIWRGRWPSSSRLRWGRGMRPRWFEDRSPRVLVTGLGGFGLSLCRIPGDGDTRLNDLSYFYLFLCPLSSSLYVVA